MFEMVTHALEFLEKDDDVIDVLNTVSATALSLADKVISPIEIVALNIVIAEAEKKIEELTQTAQ